jgi:hypothetical protein
MRGHFSQARGQGTVTHSASDEIGYLLQFVRTVEGETIQ